MNNTTNNEIYVNDATTNPPKSSYRGFASWSPEKRAEVSRMGGKAAHIKDPITGKAPGHEFSIEEARIQGRKGGLKTNEIKRQRKMGQA